MNPGCVSLAIAAAPDGLTELRDFAPKFVETSRERSRLLNSGFDD